MNISEWVAELFTSLLTAGAEIAVAIEMKLTKDNTQFIYRYTDTFTANYRVKKNPLLVLMF